MIFGPYFGIAQPTVSDHKFPGQTVPYACITGRNLGYSYCGRAFAVGRDYMFPLHTAAVIAATYDPRVKGAIPRGGLAACVGCCDAVAAEAKREETTT
jgi:hypothetical protein